MSVYQVFDMLVPVILAFSCGVMAAQLRTRQQQRRIRRITARVLGGE